MLTLDGWQKLDRSLRNAAPAITTLLMMLVSMVPLHLSGFGTIIPSISLMASFYWAVYRPDLFGPLAAFLLGLVADTISGSPLGLNSLLNLVTYASVLSQRQLFLAHSFIILWWGYALVAVLAGIVGWIVYSIGTGSWLSLEPALFQAIAGLAIFPLVAWLYGRLQRGLGEAD
jgi:rod shape-determining protein MreD